jgi:hypothetical protein
MDTLKDAGRVLIADKQFTDSISNANLAMHLLLRVSAKEVTFDHVSFQYVIFDHCYFRNCKFFNCDFTGAHFLGSNLRGSSFDGSRFDYCRFSTTAAPLSIIERHMPGYENVALELARSLRVNYAQLGDVKGVNRAIAAELAATKIHLHKATWSAESYYRSKYSGLERWKVGLEFFFMFFEGLWGNGEYLGKLLRTILIVNFLLAGGLYISGESLLSSLQIAFALFLGTGAFAAAHPIFAIVAAFTRFVLLGMFVSVLVKRLARR